MTTRPSADCCVNPEPVPVRSRCLLAMRLCYLLPLLLVWSFSPICSGQTIANRDSGAGLPPAGSTSAGGGLTADDQTSSPADIPKGTLGPEYIDASFGIEFRPLAGATMRRRKRSVENRVELAQFVRHEIAWSLALRLQTSARPIDVQAAREALELDLVSQYPDSRVIQAEPARIGAREAVRLSAYFSAEGQIWLRQQAVIRLRPKDYIFLILIVPFDDRDVAARTFDQIVESFQVVRTEAQQQQIDAALERGFNLAQEVAEGRKKLAHRIEESVFLRLMREGRPIGAVEIRESADTLGGRQGVRSLQQIWLFHPDKSVQFLQEEKFLAADLSFDEWRNLSQLLPSPQVDPQQRLVVHMEAGIRRGDQLVVKYAGTGVDEEDKVIEVEPSYASSFWSLLLPRVAELQKPDLYAYSMYDSERRGMILRTFRVVGPAQVTVGRRRMTGIRIEDSEGLLPPINDMIVDDAGRLLQLSSGPVEMRLSTADALEREFGERIRTTQRRFRENADLPEPSAGPEPRRDDRR